MRCRAAGVLGLFEVALKQAKRRHQAVTFAVVGVERVGFLDRITSSGETVACVAVTLRPNVLAAGRCIDQLDGNTHPFTGTSDTTLNHIANSEIIGDLLNLHRFAFVGES